MDLRHLRYLVAVAEAGTFATAAKWLRVAQPALTRQIRDTERELGAQIFERLPRQITPTPVGAECIRAAATVLDRARLAADRARLAQEGAIGRAVIAVGKLPLGSGEAARLIARIKIELPAVDVEVIGAALEKQWTLLLDDEADIGIGADPPGHDENLASRRLLEFELDSAVLAKNHPLAGRSSLQLADLANETLLWYGVEGSEYDDNLEREIHRHAVPIRVERPPGGIDTITARVGALAGWSLAPDWYRDRLPSGLTSVPLSDLSVLGHCFVIRRASDDRPIVHRLIDLMARLANGEGPRPAANAQPSPPRWSAQGLPDIDHLRHFVVVVEEGSYGLAAGRLQVTQPALSRQMRALERDVGAPLLVRGTRGVTPTAAGDSLVRDAPAILSAMDELEAHGGRISRAIEGRCIMAIVETPTIARLAAHIARLAERSSPRIELAVTGMDTPLQAMALAKGSIDLAIGHAFPFSRTPPSLVREPLATGYLDTAILPAAHRLAGRKSLKLHDLAGEPLVFMEREIDPDFHDLVMEAFALNGLIPTRGPSYRSLEVIWAMVAEGLGWTLGGDAQQHEPPGGTVGVVISDFSLPWGVDLLFAAGEFRPTVLTLLDFVRAAARQDLSPEARSADRPASPAVPAQTPPGSRRPAARRRSRSM